MQSVTGKPMDGPKHGFSLVELIVVISVIGLLVTLAVPAAGRAREKARQSKCSANLRSVALAAIAYSGEDRRGLLIPCHPTADQNERHDDGFYDYGGRTGSGSLLGGTVGPFGRTADTRPLNRLIESDAVYECPSDCGLGAAVQYPDWPVWDRAMETTPIASAVGTSYWGNAVRVQSGRSPHYSFGVFLRRSSAIVHASETVLFYEAAALFNYLLTQNEPSRASFYSLGKAGWHGSDPRYVIAFCDGHVESVLLAPGIVSPPPADVRAEIRSGSVWFDCAPSPPILDLPVGELVSSHREGE